MRERSQAKHVARALILDTATEPSPLIESVLSGENVASVTTRTLEGARKALEPGDLDLWILSVNGEDDPAWELVSQARTQLPEGAGLIVLGKGSPRGLERALDAGASCYLPEPVGSLELHHAVRQCVARLHLYRENQALKSEASLFQVIKSIALAMDLDTLLGLILDASITLTSGEAGSVLLCDEETGRLAPGATRGTDDSHPDAALFGLSQSYLESLLHAGSPILLSAASPDLRPMRCTDAAVESALLAPIAEGGRSVGMALVVRLAPPPFDSGSLRLLGRLAEETALAIQNAQSVRRTRELVIKDDLTYAHNRRYFESYLEDELQRSKRYGANLSLIFLDLDNLKAINNAHGHFIGSRMLQEVAQRIILTVRGIDKVVRYGGDEFCVILPETDVEGAHRVAERIRQAVAQQPYLVQEGLNLPMTVSLGIATCPTHARTKEELVRMADKAMFRSKGAQKNVVTIATAAAATGGSSGNEP